MTERHLDLLEDYEAMCLLLGPLDFQTFCDGYAAYERWKTMNRQPQLRQQRPPERMELAMAS